MYNDHAHNTRRLYIGDHQVSLPQLQRSPSGLPTLSPALLTWTATHALIALKGNAII